MFEGFKKENYAILCASLGIGIVGMVLSMHDGTTGVIGMIMFMAGFILTGINYLMWSRNKDK